MDRDLYIASNHKVLDPKRKKFLDEHKSLLVSLLDTIEAYVRSYPEDPRFFRYITDDIQDYTITLRKETRKKLKEFEIIIIINFLEYTLGLSKSRNLNGDDLVNYLYELTKICNNTYKEDLTQKNRKSSIISMGNNIFFRKNKSFYTWNNVSKEIANKVINHHIIMFGMLGIPQDMLEFFNFLNAEPGDQKQFIIQYKNKDYKVHIEMEVKPEPRFHIFFGTEFKNMIQQEYSLIYQNFKSGFVDKNEIMPKLQIIRNQNDCLKFKAVFIDQLIEDIGLDLELEKNEYYTIRKEGKVVEYYVKKYERSLENRMKAIEFHGLICKGCKMNFEDYYGDWGKGFIEVHHIKPLSTLEKEVEINPKTDLVPLCSNCHRMVHRKKDEVLSIEELKHMISNQKLNKN